MANRQKTKEERLKELFGLIQVENYEREEVMEVFLKYFPVKSRGDPMSYNTTISMVPCGIVSDKARDRRVSGAKWLIRAGSGRTGESPPC